MAQAIPAPRGPGSSVIDDVSASRTSVQSITSRGHTWVSVERPTASEADLLVHDFGLLRSDLEEALDRGRVPGVWHRDTYVVVVVHVPVVSTGQQRPGPVTSPVTIFVGPTFLVTIHTGEIRQILRLFRHYETDEQARDDVFENGSAAVLHAIVSRLLDAMVFARGQRTLGGRVAARPIRSGAHHPRSSSVSAVG